MTPKERVGLKASEFVKDGMVVGLGTGTTANYFIQALAKRITNEKLNITGVVTSQATAELAQQLGVPTKNIDEVHAIDLTVDGADEISRDFDGIKGGGGALLYEKLVATYSKKNIWVAEERKMVDQLGSFALPIEVVQFASQHLFAEFENKGYHPKFRQTMDGEHFVTDNGNYIIDLSLELIENPTQFNIELNALPGVVETGLFCNMVDVILLAKQKYVQMIETPFFKERS